MTILYRAALVAMFLSMATSACTADNRNHEAPSVPRPDLSSLVAEARQGGASPEQVALLERALQKGTLSFDDLSVQFVAGVECLEEAGFTVVVDEPEDIYPGLPHPSMRYRDPPGLTQDQASQLSVECDAKHFAFVDSFYLGQPVAIDAYLATFEDQREFIVNCLADRGVTVDPGATATELLYAVSEEQVTESGMSRAPCYEGSTFMGILP